MTDKRIIFNIHNLYNKPVTHNSTSQHRHEKRKQAALEKIRQNQIKIEEEAAAVLERKREAEKVAAEVRLAYLRKHKLPTVGLSIIGQAESKTSRFTCHRKGQNSYPQVIKTGI